MNTIALSDLRANLPSIIKKMEHGLDKLIITVSGKPKAVLVSLKYLESLEKRIGKSKIISLNQVKSLLLK